jgi:hypothetical protein
MGDRWQAKLARPIIMRDGTKIETLAEAGQFILALPGGDQHRNSWLIGGRARSKGKTELDERKRVNDRNLREDCYRALTFIH